MIVAQTFDEQFKDWFADGMLSSAGYVLVVLLVTAVVLSTVGRSSR